MQRFSNSRIKRSGFLVLLFQRKKINVEFIKPYFMQEDDSKKSLLEQYIELSKNSLIKVQYSCGGNSTSVDEADYIPIVPDSYISESTLKMVGYGAAQEE